MGNQVTVISPGLSSIQDMGRPGYANDGVPVSGAWNRTRYEEACLLLTGNRYRNIPVIELLAGTLTVQPSKEVMTAIVGSAHAVTKGTKVPTNTVFTMTASSPTSITHTGAGPVYIAIDGLLPHLEVLGSASWDSLSSIGNPPVREGNIYQLEDTQYADTIGRFTRFKELPTTLPFHFIPHRRDYAEALEGTKWKVGQISRVGIRLSPVDPLAKLKFTDLPANLLSYPTVQGLIQIPPNGEPVVLGPDAGTAGGYATAGAVVRVDIHRLANLSPGTEILFKGTTVEEAEHRYHEYHKNLVYSVIDMQHYR